MTGLSRTGSGVSQESPPPWPSKRHVHVTSLTAVRRVLRHGVPIRGLQCVRARGLRSVRLVVGFVLILEGCSELCPCYWPDTALSLMRVSKSARPLSAASRHTVSERPALRRGRPQTLPHRARFTGRRPGALCSSPGRNCGPWLWSRGWGRWHVLAVTPCSRSWGSVAGWGADSSLRSSWLLSQGGAHFVG